MVRVAMTRPRRLERRMGRQAQKVRVIFKCCNAYLNAPMSDCLEGWTYFSHTGYCYKLITSKKTWQKARKHCQKIGKEEGGHGELASVHDGSTRNFLIGLTIRSDSSVNVK